MKRRVLILTPLLLACGPWFYNAPPPLEKYPQRIPGKGWKELFQEARPRAEDAATSLELIEGCTTLNGALPGLGVNERFAKIDTLLTRNREGNFNARVATYLHELRELAATDAGLAGAKEYLADRAAQLKSGSRWGSPQPERDWSETDEEYKQTLDDYEERQASLRNWAERAERGVREAPAALQPYYQVQHAGFLFLKGNYPLAEDKFRAVAENYPDHPRAEVARFMIGRALLARAQRELKDDEDPQHGAEHCQAAAAAFQSYLESYPEGRFVPDAHGWISAAKLAEGDYGKAIEEQLQRLSIRPSREAFRSVLRECDAIFAEIFEYPDTTSGAEELVETMPWDQMAAQPEVARLFVFQALDPVAREELNQGENFSSDRRTLDFLHRRIIAPRPFAKNALARLGEAVVRRHQGAPDALTLTILGWSSLLEDEPGQALALFDRVAKEAATEDLLQGRAVALAGLGRYREAADTYDHLVSGYPDSTLADSCAFDRAIARFRGGEAGAAFLDLYAQTNGPDGYSPNPSSLAKLHPEYEARQWLDAIVQFGDLDSLAKPLAGLPPDDPATFFLRAAVRGRAIGAHRFDLALQALDPAIIEKRRGDDDPYEEDAVGNWLVPERLRMDRAKWDRRVAPLAEAYKKLQAGGGKDAALELEIARLWQKQRGELCLPLQQLFACAGSEDEKLDLLRRHNGRFLGLSAATVEEQLDSRDELEHALPLYLAAAEHSQDSAVAAPALEAANDALFRLAEFSHYRAARAEETGANALSAKLVKRLREDFPTTAEAARAVPWNFVPPTLLGRWMPGDYSASNSAYQLIESLEYPGPDPEHHEFEWTLESLTEKDDRDMAAIHQQIGEWREDFAKHRTGMEEEMLVRLGDDLEDLYAASSLPDVTPDLFRKYVPIRQFRTIVQAAEGEWQPLAPCLDFLDRIRQVDDSNGWPRLNNDTLQSWQEYLAKYPDGPKTEAAQLRLLRWKVRGLSPIPQIRAFHFPESPIMNGYKRLTPAAKADEGEVKALGEELAAYEKRFPAGRYAADIRLLRGALANLRGDYPASLAAFTATLDDPAHPELRMDAALRFAEVGLRLLDKDERVAVAAAFHKTPAAMPYLRKMVKGDTCLYRLHPLMPWLEGMVASAP